MPYDITCMRDLKCDTKLPEKQKQSHRHTVTDIIPGLPNLSLPLKGRERLGSLD